MYGIGCGISGKAWVVPGSTVDVRSKKIWSFDERSINGRCDLAKKERSKVGQRNTPTPESRSRNSNMCNSLKFSYKYST
jgi:hypothetical protein